MVGGKKSPKKPTQAESNIPIGSMYGIYSYIYHKNQPNVGKYTIHGSYGISPAKSQKETSLPIIHCLLLSFRED